MPPTTSQIREAFHNSMWYEIAYTFGIPEHNQFDYCSWEMINFCRMGHARVLYAFLETTADRRFKDDVLAVDFGYSAATITLSSEDRDRLNKDLFHFSYGRLRHDPPTNKRWPNSIIGNLHQPVVDFMKWISANREDLFEPSPRTTKEEWDGFVRLLESGHEIVLRCYQNHRDESQYRIEPGRRLQTGTSELSILFPFEF